MKPVLLICMFVAGNMANPVSYGAPAQAPPVSSYYSPAPAAPAAAPAYGSSYGASSEQPPAIPITRYNHEMEEGKSHRISFETGHGISHEEHTQIRLNPNAVGNAEDADAGKATVTKSGTIAYNAPEGHRVSLQYTADENGFHPTGDHLPVPPALPAELVEATRQFQIAYDLAAKAAAQAQQQQGGGGYGSSYGYAAPAPAAPVAKPVY